MADRPRREERRRREKGRREKARMDAQFRRRADLWEENRRRLLGLVPGAVLMCECAGQFSRRCAACRKFWSTPRSPSRSQSLSPARYLHQVFRDGAMRVEECPLSCESAGVFMHSFLDLEHACTSPPHPDTSSSNADPPTPMATPPASPVAPSPSPPPARHPRPVAPPRRQVAPPPPALPPQRLEPRVRRRPQQPQPLDRPDPPAPAPQQSGPQPADVEPPARPPPRRSGRIRRKPDRYQSIDFRSISDGAGPDWEAGMVCTLVGECTASCSLPSGGCGLATESGIGQTVFCSMGPDWEAGVVCTLVGECTASCSLPSGGCRLATESVCFSQQHSVPELGSGDGAHTRRGVPVIPADHGACVSWRVANLQRSTSMMQHVHCAQEGDVGKTL